MKELGSKSGDSGHSLLQLLLILNSYLDINRREILGKGLEGVRSIKPEKMKKIRGRQGDFSNDEIMVILGMHDERLMAMSLQLRIISTILLRACQQAGLLQAKVPPVGGSSILGDPGAAEP